MKLLSVLSMLMYVEKNLTKTSIFTNMFRLKLKHNCFLEINNLLAKHQNNITEIDIDHILLIAQKYKIQIHRYYFKETF